MPMDLADVARRAAESGGEEAVASVSLRRELVVRCSPDGALAAPRRTFDVLVRLMVRDGAGRLGVARCSNSTTDDQLQLLSERAHEQAAASQLDLRALPEVESGEPHDGFDPPTAELDPLHAVGAARVAAGAIDMTVGLGRFARWRSEAVDTFVARSGGGDAADRRTGVRLEAEATDGDGRLVGFAQASAAAQAIVDPVTIGWAATPLPLLLGHAGGPLVLARGDAVVLLPAALAPMLEALSRAACTGHAHATGTSPFTGRLGTYVAAAGVHLSDVPQDPRSLARSIDVEGVPAIATGLLQDGAATGVIHDSASAAEAGARSTGHAAELGGTPGGPAARNLVLDGGTAGSIDALTAIATRTVVIGRIDAIRADAPGGTRFSAIGRAAYTVDHGQPAQLLGDVLLSGDLVDLLAHAEAIGSHTELVATLDRLPERTTATRCPPIRTRGVAVLVG